MKFDSMIERHNKQLSSDCEWCINNGKNDICHECVNGASLYNDDETKVQIVKIYRLEE
jgi:hypothetical protein